MHHNGRLDLHLAHWGTDTIAHVLNVELLDRVVKFVIASKDRSAAAS